VTHCHPIQRLYLAEDLVRLRRADEHRRHVASQRSARIDPNPHQIDAVMFALARIPDGGCILADEVGLGKTIEAGLVIAQVLAEGATRVLVVTPKALLGQWKQELFALFGIDAHEVARDASAFAGQGVFLATRDFVGGEAGAKILQAADRFDLCVVDEAHEIFAGIYRRFDYAGAAREDSPHARMAHRLSEAIRASGTPVLLLTATPIQNSLLELWGLVHYVDPTGTLLGELNTFREIFCPADDRVLAEGQDHELQRRLGTVLQRTLRREAQEFMREPFMGRQARTFDYTMSPEERSLYDDVTSYLLEPALFAFRGNQRTLLLMTFHRRMASSIAALVASLENVAERLRALRDRRPPGRVSDDGMRGDLEDDEPWPDDVDGPTTSDEAPRVSAELSRVEAFIERARALPTDSKGHALLRAIQLLVEQAELGKSSGKVVIFTEALTTQDYIRRLLIGSRLVGDGDITTFRGNNNSPRASQALERWEHDVGSKLPPDTQPSPDIAVRLALVHEFQHRSRVLISTEAGAKGLNLQFCDTVINYDLPWNPQRIEQRIGRCHRYGQRRDVTVINFLARDNAAQQLTYEILSQKLELFGTVLGATDEVLHRPGSLAPESLVSAAGNDFEAQLRRIYERSRSLDEVERELRELRDSIETRRKSFEAAHQRTEAVIRRRFDVTVQQAFRRIQAELPRELEEFDRHIERVVVDYLDAIGASYRREQRGKSTFLEVDPFPALPEAIRTGTACLVGSPTAESPLFPLHLGHPLVEAALREIRTLTRSRAFAVKLVPQVGPLDELRGRRGRLRLVRVRYRGLEATERLVPVVVLAGSAGPLDIQIARQLLDGDMAEVSPPAVPSVPEELLTDAVDEVLFLDLGDASAREQPRFERTIEQVERFAADRVLLLERQRAAAIERQTRAQSSRDNAMGADQRTRAEAALVKAQNEIDRLDAQIARLRAGDDDTYKRWRAHTEGRRYAPPEFEQLLDAELEIA
jgi:hypothetical protein